MGGRRKVCAPGVVGALRRGVRCGALAATQSTQLETKAMEYASDRRKAQDLWKKDAAAGQLRGPLPVAAAGGPQQHRTLASDVVIFCFSLERFDFLGEARPLLVQATLSLAEAVEAAVRQPGVTLGAREAPAAFANRRTRRD